MSCLKLRHLNPDDKLNALVTNHSLYFMKVGSPSADHVVLTIKLLHLYKARHRNQGMQSVSYCSHKGVIITVTRVSCFGALAK